jgi:hypothetical protein
MTHTIKNRQDQPGDGAQKWAREVAERVEKEDARMARLALEDAEVNGTVPWEQVKAELGLKNRHPVENQRAPKTSQQAGNSSVDVTENFL